MKTMHDDRIIAYEDQLLKKESLIKLAFVMSLVLLACAMVGYTWLKSTQFPFVGNILLPLILGGGLYALASRAELKHIATIKRYRGLDHIQPEHHDSSGNHSTLAKDDDGR